MRNGRGEERGDSQKKKMFFSPCSLTPGRLLPLIGSRGDDITAAAWEMQAGRRSGRGSLGRLLIRCPFGFDTNPQLPASPTHRTPALINILKPGREGGEGTPLRGHPSLPESPGQTRFCFGTSGVFGVVGRHDRGTFPSGLIPLEGSPVWASPRAACPLLIFGQGERFAVLSAGSSR